MASHGSGLTGFGTDVSTQPAAVPRTTPAEQLSPLARVRDALGAGTTPEVTAALADAVTQAEQVAGAGGGAEAQRQAAIAYLGAAFVAFAADGELEPDDVRATMTALAEVTGVSRKSLDLAVYRVAVMQPSLLELPPPVAAGIVLRLLVDFDVLDDLSLWRRSTEGQPECVLQTNVGEPARRVRAEARAVLRGRQGLSIVGRSTFRSARVKRFGQVTGAVVGRALGSNENRTAAFLGLASQALGPVLERELLLERSREREQALASSAERRLTRLAFDLHDGPIQDVLALAADVRFLQQQLYPFVLDTHRELAFGRFDDITARLGELDRTLREVSHSLESKSIVSRPLGEILHREVDAFAARTGIETTLELRGDPESLDSAQRITVFRAIQEALANVREHSGATVVDIRVRARRSSIEVRIVDNGAGFEVSRSLARAAKRGRLGLVGIGERVRMLGGTFDLDSRPGGPTTLSFTLPR